MPDLESLKKEHEKLLLQLANPELLSDWGKFQEMAARKNFLEKVFEKEKELEEMEKKIKENQAIITANEDGELVSLAQSENIQLRERINELGDEMENLLKKNSDGGNEKEPDADTAAIIEIRAGTGGQEAALFAGELLRMYSKYAQTQGWTPKTLDSSPTELGGFKEVIFEIKAGGATFKGNRNVFQKMQYEGGVHRVQRIPSTEKAGRVHTSTASVAVLQKPKTSTIKIRSDELKVSFYCSSGPGGQYVNKRHTAVRITHLPSGLVVTSQTERDQFQNKNNALSILEARLLERQTKTQENKLSDKRKTQIGQAKRAEKIRTYNFPQDRLTDHRTRQSWHNLEKIMNGELEPVIEDLKENLK